MRIHDDVTRLVGSTPLVRIAQLFSGAADGVTVAGKLEAVNPSGSVKDRVGVAIVDAAERAGALQPGGVIVEATSGNTGIALAMVGAARGYQVVLTMPETMSRERRRLLAALGAELVLTPGPSGMRGAVERAEEIATTRGGILASQFANPANPAVHAATTAEEIWTDTDGTVDVVVAGIGTGGTVTGLARTLRAHKPEVSVIGVEPAESPILNGGTPGPHAIQGIGANFVPPVLDREALDEVVDVDADSATTWARAAATRAGLLVGISAGAALAATATVVARPELAGRTVVVMLPDTGERYLSSGLFEDATE